MLIRAPPTREFRRDRCAPRTATTSLQPHPGICKAVFCSPRMYIPPRRRFKCLVSQVGCAYSTRIMNHYGRILVPRFTNNTNKLFTHVVLHVTACLLVLLCIWGRRRDVSEHSGAPWQHPYLPRPCYLECKSEWEWILCFFFKQISTITHHSAVFSK